MKSKMCNDVEVASSEHYAWKQKKRPQLLHRRPNLWLVAFGMAIGGLYAIERLSRAIYTKAPLTVTSQNTFQIAVFADLHFGENESTFGPPADRASTALMRQVLSQEKPDLAVLNGDLITGENTFAFNSSQYVDEIVTPLIEGGYRWASTYGNHDSKFNLDRESVFTEEKKYENSYTDHGPPSTDGVTNYALEVWPRNTSSCIKPRALLWFFDSRGGAEYQHTPANVDNIPNHVSNATVDWYRSAQASLQV